MVVICAGPLLVAAPGPKIELSSAVIGSLGPGVVVVVVPFGSVTVGGGGVGSAPTVGVGTVPVNPPVFGCDGAVIGVVVTVTGSVVTL